MAQAEVIRQKVVILLVNILFKGASMMKVLKNLFVMVGICMLCLFNAGTANAENWIAKDSYYNAQWDADSVYSNDYGNIINFTMKFYNANNGTTTVMLAQLHNQEMFKTIYGKVYDSNGNLLEEGPLNAIYPIFMMDSKDMCYDVIRYYQQYVR